MAPHVSEFTGEHRITIAGSEHKIGKIYREIPNTRHRTNDGSLEETLAHELIASDPDRYHEEGDIEGPPCAKVE